MASNSTIWLPQLQALLAQAPAGSNPFAWWLQRFAGQLGSPQAAWAKPIFILIAVLSGLNIVGAVVALLLKYRQDGTLSLYKMRDHRNGGRYICLNTATVFLLGHILTCLVFGIYVLLHTYFYNQSGRSYQDLSWATMMWIAPYVSILMTSTGVLYGVLVAPTGLANISRSSKDTLLPPQLPLAGLPCWLLNAFVFTAPMVVIVSVLVPSILLVLAVKKSEHLGIQFVQLVVKYGDMYQQGVYPSTSEQASFLQLIVDLQSFNQRSRSLWRPTFGLWSGWVALAGLLSIVAFVAIYRVTKARLGFARRQYASAFEFSGQYDSNDIFHEKPLSSSNKPVSSTVISQARSDFISLSLQFGLAAILLFICEIMLLWDTVVGYDIHLKSDLTATALMVPPLAYFLHATVSLVLIILRISRNQHGRSLRASRENSASAPGTPTSEKFGQHYRQESDTSLLPFKRHNPSSISRTKDSGRVLVNSTSKSYGVAPSLVHQVEVTQTIEIHTDKGGSTEVPTVPRPTRLFAQESDSESKEDLTMLRPVSNYGLAL